MTIYPNGGALTVADGLASTFGTAELRLFKEIAAPLSVSTVLADFTSANFSGYGEFAVDTWNLAYLDPAGGATLSTPSHNFNFITPVLPALPVTNVVLGWYLVSGGNDLVVAGTFDSPVAMAAPGDAIPLQVLMNFCRN